MVGTSLQTLDSHAAPKIYFDDHADTSQDASGDI